MRKVWGGEVGREGERCRGKGGERERDGEGKGERGRDARWRAWHKPTYQGEVVD